MNKAVFIDKDGTLINDVPYNVDVSRISFAPGVIDGMMLLKNSGFKLIVVSNQSGIARGFFTEAQLHEVSKHIQKQLAQYGLRIDSFYYCPHCASGTVKEYSIECICRKPWPGLLLKAAKDYHINLNLSWMIGDILNDVEAGHNAGCKTILINNGNETEWVMSPERTPGYIVKNFKEAAEIILALKHV